MLKKELGVHSDVELDEFNSFSGAQHRSVYECVCLKDTLVIGGGREREGKGFYVLVTMWALCQIKTLLPQVTTTVAKRKWWHSGMGLSFKGACLT